MHRDSAGKDSSRGPQSSESLAARTFENIQSLPDMLVLPAGHLVALERRCRDGGCMLLTVGEAQKRRG